MNSQYEPTINGRTRLLGILGSGIGHTLSPALHNFSARELGINSVYIPIDLPTSAFPRPEFFKAMWDAGATGFNVTAPFKEIAAKSFGKILRCSINTIYRGSDTWITTSTDGEGFLIGLQQNKILFSDFDRIVFLGNGGAALAIAEHLALQSQMPLFVLRRSEERDATWKSLKGNLSLSSLSAQSIRQICHSREKTLLVHTTSAQPMSPEQIELAESLVKMEGALVDIAYGQPSAFLQAAKKLEIPALDGLPMLIGQAIVAQTHWWQKSVSYEVIEGYLRTLLPTARVSARS